jgi:phage-related tail fiber protein
MSTFKTIHTAYGLQRMGQAEATGTPINLTHMAVGDGNGNDVQPFEAQTNLVREMYRATVNAVFQDPSDNTRFTAELVVPVSAGGFTMREVGVFEADGSLFAVGNLPATYKPNISEGAYADVVVRISFMVTNAGIVSIVVDPNIAVATRSWVQNNVTAALLFPGGTTNQVLAKASNAAGDTKWMDLGNVNVTVDALEEKQTLAASQTTVTLGVVTTRGLAVYVEGTRIPNGTGPHTWAAVSSTQITLGTTYDAGTKILLVQNDPAGNASQPLERDQNLGDIQDAPTARTNLGVYSKAESDSAGNPGDIKWTARNTAPPGWLKANGAALSRTAYSQLFAVIGTTYGAGDGFNTFNLPDLRGEFVRGWDDGRGADAGRVLGSSQAGQNAAHTHSASASTAGSHSHTYTDTDTNYTGQSGLQPGSAGFTDRETSQPTSSDGAHSHTISIGSSGGNEARPRNVAMLACIKY